MEYRKLLSDDFKPDGLTEVLDERLNKSREYQKKFYKTDIKSKRTILCEKCGYLFLSKGWYRHKIACDGSGPKATDFRVNEVRETECRFCGKDFRWNHRGLSSHASQCKMNPAAEEFNRKKLLSHDYRTWVKRGRKPRYPETYIRIEEELKKQGLPEDAIKVLIEDIKKGSN